MCIIIREGGLFMKENKNGKFDALEVAAYIVKKMNEEKESLDHLKLQKLLYFITLEWVREFDSYPYKQATEMWKLGPVIREVYSEYRTNGYGQISEPATRLSFEGGGIQFVMYEPANFDEQEQRLVCGVIQKFGGKNSFELVDITHEHEPWKRNEKEIKSIVKSELEYSFDDFIEASQQVH